MPGTKSAFAAAIGRRALDAWIRLRYVAKARAVMRPPPRESSVGANKRERQEGAEGGVSACLLACQTVSLPAIPPTSYYDQRTTAARDDEWRECRRYGSPLSGAVNWRIPNLMHGLFYGDESGGPVSSSSSSSLLLLSLSLLLRRRVWVDERQRRCWATAWNCPEVQTCSKWRSVPRVESASAAQQSRQGGPRSKILAGTSHVMLCEKR